MTCASHKLMCPRIKGIHWGSDENAYVDPATLDVEVMRI